MFDRYGAACPLNLWKLALELTTSMVAREARDNAAHRRGPGVKARALQDAQDDAAFLC